MIVCHCKAISDQTIRGVIRRGADSTREIARACGAGRVCGGCRPAIREVLERERSQEPAKSAAHACAHVAEENGALVIDTAIIAAR